MHLVLNRSPGALSESGNFATLHYGKRDGAVQMFGVYNRDQYQSEDVALAWEEQDFLERFAELVAGDCSLHEAVDWTVVEEAERYTVAQWADIRGVTEDAVRSNVNSAREKLLAEEDRESVE